MTSFLLLKKFRFLSYTHGSERNWTGAKNGALFLGAKQGIAPADYTISNQNTALLMIRNCLL